MSISLWPVTIREYLLKQVVVEMVSISGHDVLVLDFGQEIFNYAIERRIMLFGSDIGPGKP
jgi:hypothetical protein